MVDGGCGGFGGAVGVGDGECCVAGEVECDVFVVGAAVVVVFAEEAAVAGAGFAAVVFVFDVVDVAVDRFLWHRGQRHPWSRAARAAKSASVTLVGMSW